MSCHYKNLPWVDREGKSSGSEGRTRLENANRSCRPTAGNGNGRESVRLGRLPEPAALACADRFPALPAVLDTAREPVYALRRGRNKIPFRIRTRPKPRAEKEFLIFKLHENNWAKCFNCNVIGGTFSHVLPNYHLLHCQACGKAE